MRPEEVFTVRVRRAYMDTRKRRELVIGPLAKMSDEELMALHSLAPLSAFAHAVRAALRERDPNRPHDEFSPSGAYALALKQAMRAELGLPIDSTEGDES